MESNSWRTILITAIAPVAWGSTYIVTEKFLPPDRPLFAALVRALPVGLILLAWRGSLPPAGYRLRILVLGLCNIGLFYPLIFLSAYHLPGGIAATAQATSPLAVMAIAWALIGERPVAVRVGAALVGLLGVALLVLQSPDGVEGIGLIGAFGSVVMSGVGFVLFKKWPSPADLLTTVSWQLVIGGIALVPMAFLIEGAPPEVDLQAALGYSWIAVMGSGVAYYCWFHGLTHMTAGATALVGLINPVVGTVLGVAFAGEAFGWAQALGMSLVIGGVIAGQRRVRPSAPTPTPEPVGATGASKPPGP